MKMFCIAALKSPAAFHGQIRSLERARVSLGGKNDMNVNLSCCW